MENSDTSASSGALAVPDRGMVRPSDSTGQLSESARPSKHREHSSKSPRRRREGKRLQRRGDGPEQLLWEIEWRRLPGQHEHLEPSGSATDTAESSPKRFALQVASCIDMPVTQLCCPGHKVTPLDSFFCLFSQESPLSTWTVPSHSLWSQSLYSSEPNFSHVSIRVLSESNFVCTNCWTVTPKNLCNCAR